MTEATRDSDAAHVRVQDRCPDELLDAIIGRLACPRPTSLYDEVHHLPFVMENKHDLRAISKVSRRWRRCTIPYLFRDIDLKISADPELQHPDIQGIVRRRLIPKRNLYQFLSFLETHPHIALCVETIFIIQVLVGDVIPGEDGYPVWLVADIEPNVLASIIRHLPSLRGLGLQDIGVASSMFHGPPVTVKSLLLAGTERRSQVSPDSVLKIFSSIEHLRLALPWRSHHIDAVIAMSDESRTDIGPIIPALTIHEGTQLLVWKNVCLGSPTVLRRFTVGYNENRWNLCLEGLHDFLLAFSSKLIRFQCNMREGPDWQTYMSFLLGFIFADVKWPELEYLSLMAKDVSGKPYEEAQRSSVWYHLPEILAFFSSCSSLRKIKLSRDREPIYERSQLDFEASGVETELREGRYPSSEVMLREDYYAALERALLQFKSLQSVIFVLGMGLGSQSPDTVEEDIVVRSMPTLYQSGILQFADFVPVVCAARPVY